MSDGRVGYRHLPGPRPEHWWILRCAFCRRSWAIESPTAEGASSAPCAKCGHTMETRRQQGPPLHLHTVGLDVLWCWDNPCELS